MEKLAQGYFKASYEELVLIAEGTTFNKFDEARFTDEPARRRLLEFLARFQPLSMFVALASFLLCYLCAICLYSYFRSQSKVFNAG